MILYILAFLQGGVPPQGHAHAEEGLNVPMWAIFAVVGALATAIGFVFRTFWTALQKKDKELKECNASLLAEKEEKVKILADLKAKLEQRRGGTDVRS